MFQGYLRKEGQTRRSWKRRWFVMKRTALHYLKRPDSVKAQGAIPLAKVTSLTTNTDEYQQPYCFQLVHSGINVAAAQQLVLLTLF